MRRIKVAEFDIPAAKTPDPTAAILADSLTGLNKNANVKASEPETVTIPRPYWACQRGKSLGALSGDWDTLFDAVGASLWAFKLPTESGALRLPSFSTTYPTRAQIAFECEGPVTIRGILFMATPTNVQIKFNGATTNYTTTAGHEITLQARRGKNTLRITHDGGGDEASFEATLFNDGFCKFVKGY